MGASSEMLVGFRGRRYAWLNVGVSRTLPPDSRCSRTADRHRRRSDNSRCPHERGRRARRAPTVAAARREAPTFRNERNVVPRLPRARAPARSTRRLMRRTGGSAKRPALAQHRQMKTLRQQVRERDRTCRGCGSSWRLSVHHSIPHRYGGRDTLSNLVLLCGVCHPRYDAAFRHRLRRR